MQIIFAAVFNAGYSALLPFPNMTILFAIAVLFHDASFFQEAYVILFGFSRWGLFDGYHVITLNGDSYRMKLESLTSKIFTKSLQFDIGEKLQFYFGVDIDL